MPGYLERAASAIKKKAKPYADAAKQLGEVGKLATQGGTISHERGPGINRTTVAVNRAKKKK